MIAPAARGRNLAARALAPAIDTVFDVKGARRIFADVDPDNAASIRTFEKLGFRHEGVLRANWETHIGVRDSVIGREDRAATPGELAAMEAQVAAAMEAGAFGVSTSLQYVPDRFARTDELVALARVAGRYGGS